MRGELVPRLPSMAILAIVFGGAGLLVGATLGPSGPADLIRQAARDGRPHDVLALEARHRGLEGLTASVADQVIEAHVQLERYLELGERLLDGSLPEEDPGLFNRIAMFLQTGNRRMLDVGVRLLERAVTLEPANPTYVYDLGLLYWNSGHVEKARARCRQVLELDPGNVRAYQILERIAKSRYSGDLDSVRYPTRTVRFELSHPGPRPPILAGSWHPQGGTHSPLGGWQESPMEPAPPRSTDPSGTTRWSLTRTLTTDEGNWFAAVARDPAAPDGPALALCRFPLYPIGAEDMVIDLDDHRCPPARGILEPRDVEPGPMPSKGRVYLLCVDSATWHVAMPLVKAGMMPRLARLMARGVSLYLHSDPPVSTVAFDILNFGTVRGFGLQDVLMGGIGLLKERGVNLLSYGDIQGTEHTWNHLARLGIPTLYASWAEQLYYGSSGRESVQDLRLDPDSVPVAGRHPANQAEKVGPFLSPEAAAALETPSQSDLLIANLYDEGVKKFYQGLELMKRLDPRVTLTHVGYVDVSFHTFWDSMESERLYLEPGSSPDRRYAHVIAGMHRLLDLMLADLMAVLDLDRDTLVVFSDHGATGGFAKTYYGHDPLAMLVMAGPGIRRNEVLDTRVEMVDLVPTVCHLLGAPAPPGFPGRARTELLVPPSTGPEKADSLETEPGP